MAEILSDNKIKRLRFIYLSIMLFRKTINFGEKGFTEWVNTKKATPLFEGHYQPKVPLNENYYNLLDDNVKIWQADLAKNYGVFGFCYYHYWFKDGKKLLEKPLEQMLKNKDVDIPFCMSWANENWSKRWMVVIRRLLQSRITAQKMIGKSICFIWFSFSKMNDILP